MKVTALALLLLFASESKTWEFKYRFPKGLVYEEASSRELAMETYADARTFRFKMRSDAKLRRSIVAVDENQRPTIERVEVLSLTNTVVEDPEKKPGTKADPAQGQTFVWRRLKERWGLFDQDDSEVTRKYPRLVEKLKNWRDTRLPREKVAVGGQWEVSALTFLETSGHAVPEGVDGVALFTLDAVEKGIASISFEVLFTQTVTGTYQSCRYTGTWRFDIEKGRDLSFDMSGELKIDQGRSGKADLAMKRSVTYR